MEFCPVSSYFCFTVADRLPDFQIAKSVKEVTFRHVFFIEVLPTSRLLEKMIKQGPDNEIFKFK